MFHDFYQNLPLHIDPIAFTVGSFSIRWYAISYLVGFGVVYLILVWRMKRGEFKIEVQSSKFLLQAYPNGDKVQSEIQNKNLEKSAVNKSVSQKDDRLPASTRGDDRSLASIRRNVLLSRSGSTRGGPMTDDQELILDFLLVAFFSSLIGGRIGYALFYNLPYFLAYPLAIISPYMGGNFTGIYGMSYHGALVGIILGSWIFLWIKKINFWHWADFVVPAVPLGYFFGRIGNFLNGELYGRMTNSPLGMYFVANPSRLRYPSQLFEAFLEGLLLFFVLWKIRKIKMPSGSLFSLYLIGYGAFRILAEQFRQPDPQVAFLFGFITMGQLLSSGMVITGGLLLLFLRKK